MAMKGFIICLIIILNSGVIFGQLGIGTAAPKATLHTVGEPADPSIMDGIIPPGITAAQLSAKTYTLDQNGAMVYVTDDATGTAQADQVNGMGLYIFDGMTLKWKSVSFSESFVAQNGLTKLTSGEIELGGTLLHSTFIEAHTDNLFEIGPNNGEPLFQIDGTNAKAVLGDANGWNNGTSVVVNDVNSILSFNTRSNERIRITADGDVGIGITDPKSTLHVGGDPENSIKLDGIIAPRIMAAQLSAKTYTLDQNGAMVYVTDDAAGTAQADQVNGMGLYIFDGTTLRWKKVNSNAGSVSSDNGLTKTGNNIQIGGSLIQNTTIDQSGFEFAQHYQPAQIFGEQITEPSSLIMTRLNGKLPGIFGGSSNPFGANFHIDDPFSGVYTSHNLIGTPSESFVGLAPSALGVSPLIFESLPALNTNRGVYFGDHDLGLIYTTSDQESSVIIGDGGYVGIQAREQFNSIGSTIFTRPEDGITFTFDNSGTFSEYTFPRIDGSANQILTTNGLGQLTWQNANLQSITESGNLSMQPIGIYDPANDDYMMIGPTDFGLHVTSYNTGSTIFLVQPDNIYFGADQGQNNSAVISRRNVTADREFFLPDGNGSLALSVNGIPANVEGNISLPMDFLKNTANTQLELGTNSTGASRTPDTEFVIKDNGNVGIGTQNPNEKLEINGRILASQVRFTGLPTFPDEAAATAGGLVTGEIYKTATGEIRIKL